VGRSPGHQWAILLTIGGQVCWPPTGRISWPLTTVRTRVAAVLPTLERRVQRRHDMVQVTEHTQVRSALDDVGRRADG
jgi:hypothetical protein